ncbi:dTDP-4-dehydrorhamnose reductase [Vibrio sp. 99-8-1]|uniref:dTDP-4-dehydrorhamnose reductase n=1 Tax=Vibrio sp. 99-8-1 TaxID=2607602 RepID=UPI001493603D|nr:dTDP-4-dehydrorhamnose reductase [Vibrio sp. 99-8-1]NOI68724.1 dTDP-4-dehydrorhamnose reductase [Vibrio sp. 99-8-1]
MNVLITGVDGQVGQILARRMPEKINFIGLTREQLDITNEKAVENVFERFKPNIVVNAAAYTKVEEAELNSVQAMEINSTGPSLLAQQAEKHKSVLIHLSTDYVFDGNSDLPYIEHDIAIPLNIYGKSKLAGEVAIANTCTKYLIIRTSWIFSECGCNFIKTMLRLAMETDVIKVVDDQFGGPTYAGDIADTIIKLIQNLEVDIDIQWGVYHYSGYPFVSWYEFACSLFEVTAKSSLSLKEPKLVPVASSEYKFKAKRPKNSKLNCSKIYQEFFIEPCDWKKALKMIEKYSD